METTCITASGLVYLFGEDFADPNEGRLTGSQTRLVHSGQKVGSVSLAHSLFLAAFVSLAHEGYISLRVEQKTRGLLSPTDTVTITKEKEGDDLPPSLEREIMDSIGGDPPASDVKEAVEWVTRKPEFSERVKWTVSCVMNALAEAGYLEWVLEPGDFFAYEVHWWAEPDEVAPLAREVDTLKNNLRTFESADPRLYKRLVEEVNAGFGIDTAWLEMLFLGRS
jgi:hypothetical protein